MVTLMAALATGLAAGITVHLTLRSRGRRARSPHTRRLPGLDVSPVQFWATVLSVAGVTFFVLFAITDLVFVSLVPSAVVATLPKAYFSRKHAQRTAQIQEAWPDGLRDILASVRSGSSLPNSIENLAVFGPEPLREVFQGFDVYSRSLGVVPALEMVKDDVADPSTDRVVEVLIVAYERGGPAVPEILSDLAQATTRDLWAAEQIRTEALEQKINSRVVFVLPWIVLVAITARPGPFREFYSTTTGLIVVALGGVMSLVGVAIASRLGAQPVEPRVFARGQGL